MDGPSDQLDGPSDKIDDPSDQLDGPSDKIDDPSDQLDGPSDKISGGPSDQISNASDQIDGPSEQKKGTSADSTSSAITAPALTDSYGIPLELYQPDAGELDVPAMVKLVRFCGWKSVRVKDEFWYVLPKYRQYKLKQIRDSLVRGKDYFTTAEMLFTYVYAHVNSRK